MARPGSNAGTPRLYRTAIRSAPRRGRGVSAGGHAQSNIKITPVRAIWLSNRKDDRFGRLFVEFGDTSGKAGTIGASRVLFADSFYAATSVTWGKDDSNVRYNDGEILILMSMDPASTVTANIEDEYIELTLSKLNAKERDRLETTEWWIGLFTKIASRDEYMKQCCSFKN